MADSDKDILITPNTSAAADPKIVFSSGATSGDPITLSTVDDGTTSTLSFEGSAGQLFSISNDMSGTIFSVGDVSGVPSIEVDASGDVRIGEFGGNVQIGNSSGNVTMPGSVKASAYKEPVTTSTTTSGTFNLDIHTSSILYLDTAMTANWTINVRGDGTTTDLNAALSTGESVTVVCLATQGATPYYNNILQINSVTQTVKWQGGTAPTAGNASSVDSYSYTIIKTAASTYTVLGNLTQFA